MSTTRRRILYLFFFALFFASAPVVLLYSLGYVYNSKKGTLENLGGVYLEYVPKNASVSLNGSFINTSSPADVSGLVPGMYTIALTKDGFHPWSKRVSVLPLQTQAFSDINLFPIASPTPSRILPIHTTPSKRPVSHFSLSPKNNTLIAELLSTGATTTVQLSSLDQFFELPGMNSLIQFDSAKQLFSITAFRQKKLESHQFSGVKGFDVQNGTLMFWNEYELWVFSDSSLAPELITRTSRGISMAAFYRGQYLVYATADGSILAIERGNIFGRWSQLLAVFEHIADIFIGDDTLYMNVSRSEKPEWLSLPLR